MFPKDFIWGAATAAYQIEGAAAEGGKGESIWDVFCREPGKIKNGDTGEVACDHYHRYREDVELMKKIGLKGYRLSLSWPRILPQGTGKVNQEGIAFYRSLLSELKNAGITPFVTLYHWDLPRALFDRGGWTSPEAPAWFEEYARVVAERLGDLFENVITFNEPSVFLKGLINGAHAPGFVCDTRTVFLAWHHILLAHGKADRVFRSIRPEAKIGVAPCSTPYIPAAEEDTEACRKEYFALHRRVKGASYNIRRDFCNVPSMFLDPIVFGRYPEGTEEVFADVLPQGWEKDLETIHSKLDFLAENIYQGRVAKKEGEGIALVPPKPGYPRTAIDWQITPEAMYYMLRFIYDRYKIPMIISENGISCHDWISLDGAVHDPNRIDYLNRHLLQAERAIDDGVKLFAYFHWSLMDNMEWARGYFDRFGLIYVDFETGERTLKDSALWYRSVIESNGAALHAFEKPAGK